MYTHSNYKNLLRLLAYHHLVLDDVLALRVRSGRQVREQGSRLEI